MLQMSSTAVMPKCCCCSVKTGLLIWIGLGLILNVVGIIFRNNSIGNISLAVNGTGLAFSLFGFFSVFSGKRILVKIYAFLIVLILLVGTGISIFFMYSGDARAFYRNIYEEFVKNSDNGGVKVEFDTFLHTVLITGWVVIALSFILQAIILGFIYKYYKYLTQLEQQEKQQV
jgi:hypothetical protein